MDNIYPVLLAGGSSSRLWPISDSSHPKWELEFDGQSLLKRTWSRATKISGDQNKNLIVAGQIYCDKIKKILPELPDESLLIEPEAKDTSCALALALGAVLRQNPEAVILMLPSDHLIDSTEAFTKVVKTAVSLAIERQMLATIGIPPSSPATSYGYLHRGEELEVEEGDEDVHSYEVVSFKEKPPVATAEAYIQSGEYLWNSGIFVFPGLLLLREFERHLPSHALMAKELSTAPNWTIFNEIAIRHFPKLQRVSIDFGIMERAEHVGVVEGNFSWDDIGSWSAFGNHMKLVDENRISSNEKMDIQNSTGNIVYAPNRRVALIGVKNLIVIDGPTGLLICDISQDQLVKNAAKAAEESSNV